MSEIQEKLKNNQETRPTLDELAKLAEKAGIKQFNVFNDGNGNGGRWIEIKK